MWNTRDGFICIDCNTPPGTFGGKPAENHDIRCPARQKWETAEALRRYNSSLYGLFKTPATRNNETLEDYIYTVKMGKDINLLIKEGLIPEDNLSYNRREA